MLLFGRFNNIYGKLQFGLALLGLSAHLFMFVLMFRPSTVLRFELTYSFSQLLPKMLKFLVFALFPFAFQAVTAYFHTERSFAGRLFGIIGAVVAACAIANYIVVGGDILSTSRGGHFFITVMLFYLFLSLILTARNEIEIRQHLILLK